MAGTAGLDSGKSIVPGRGMIFISTGTNAEPFEVKSINPEDPTTWPDPAKWVSAGLTSASTTFEMTKDDGDTTTHDAWEIKGIESTQSEGVEGFTYASIEHTKEVFELLWAGGTYDSKLKAYSYASTSPVTKSVQVVYIGGNKRGGVYWRKVNISNGDASSVAVDDLLEINAKGTILAPDDGSKWKKTTRLEVRDYEAKAGRAEIQAAS